MSFLRQEAGLSLTLYRRIKRDGRITWWPASSCSGAGSLRPRTILPAGASLRLILPLERHHLEPAAVPLDVLWEDEWLICVNKPVGTVVHPTKGYQSGTLANALVDHLAKRGEPAGIHPIHRIDRLTSGAVLFAKHSWIHQALTGPRSSRLSRTYLALTEWPPAGGTSEVLPLPCDTWLTGGIEHSDIHPSRRVVGLEGKPSRTHIRPLRPWQRGTPALIWVVRPISGRTHQIRAHLAAAGMPLLGDELYGGSSALARPALHAWQLAWRHPVTGRYIRVRAPLPDDLAAFCAQQLG